MYTYRLVTGYVWLLTAHYFIVQLVVALAWDTPFSLQHNAISDLGNTVCGPYGERYVCSPLHDLMNGSFVLLGILQAAGALILLGCIRHLGASARVGLYGLVAAGLGTILVGVFPENSIGPLHLVGAALPFVLGNIGTALCAALFRRGSKLYYFSIASGVVGLLACVLLVSQMYFGLGFGGIERITAYPQTVWMIVVGLAIITGKWVFSSDSQRAKARAKSQR